MDSPRKDCHENEWDFRTCFFLFGSTNLGSIDQQKTMEAAWFPLKKIQEIPEFFLFGRVAGR